MSLNYNLEKCKYRPKSEDGKMHPVTHVIILMTMHIGMGEITSENYIEFFSRLDFWQKTLTDGGLLQRTLDEGKHENIPITIEDVASHIGLSTNVFPKETQAKFAKKVFEMYKERLEYQITKDVGSGKITLPWHKQTA